MLISTLFLRSSLNGVAPKTRKILQLLRLRQINSGVFIRLNRATTQMLRLVEPYVAYGYVARVSVCVWRWRDCGAYLRRCGCGGDQPTATRRSSRSAS